MFLQVFTISVFNLILIKEKTKPVNSIILGTCDFVGVLHVLPGVAVCLECPAATLGHVCLPSGMCMNPPCPAHGPAPHQLPPQGLFDFCFFLLHETDFNALIFPE